VTIAGATIPAGSWCLRRSPPPTGTNDTSEPDLLDITREPNKHLSFAWERTSASVRRSPDGGADCDRHAAAPRASPASGGPSASLSWRPELVLRGLAALPVAVGGQGEKA